MKRIRLYRHPDCPRCRRLAALHARLDWLDRIEDRAGGAPVPLRLGEIVVEDVRTGTLLRGAQAVRAIARQVPLYWLLLPLLRIPAVRRRAEADACGAGSCLSARP